MTLHPRHIRAGRALIDTTQDDMAKAAKLSLATLNNIEREVAHPRQKTFDKIRLALADAGVNITVNDDVERVQFTPRGYIEEELGTPIRDTLSRLMWQNSLLNVRRALFFSFEDDFHRCGLYLEGRFRQVLYIGSGLNTRHRIGLAELAAVAIAARKELRNQVFFAENILTLSQREGVANDFDAVVSLTNHRNFERFLDLFPESRSVIDTARKSDQHPLFHVLHIFGAKTD
ncbi:MAG: helix-turn-helix transcriptional regulator [Alphaproteobacteria bacterium]|nr:helix-turn-helix transcriptional regulator [Alphaproteobacteria bacterium]